MISGDLPDLGTTLRGRFVGDFDHFLLTRFNTRQGLERAGDDWLKHRLDYFERVCRRSITGQTEKGFKWLVFFDDERDQWFQKEVDRLSAGVFEPIWVSGALTTGLIAESVAARSSSPWLITTRMDNDDAAARDFIETIQAEFSGQEFEFINLKSGMQLTDDGALFRWVDLSSPFISLVERRMQQLPRTVHLDGHDRLHRHGHIRQAKSAHPMWIQMVHGRNLANTAKGVRASPAALSNHFDIDCRVVPIGALSLRITQVTTLAKLTTRVICNPRRIWKGVRILAERLRY